LSGSGSKLLSIDKTIGLPGLEVHGNPALANEVHHADHWQRQNPVLAAEIDFDTQDGSRIIGQLAVEVGAQNPLTRRPAVFRLFVVVLDALLLFKARVGLVVGLKRLFGGQGRSPPPGAVEGLQARVNGTADVQVRGLGCLKSQHLLVIEAQAAGEEGFQAAGAGSRRPSVRR